MVEDNNLTEENFIVECAKHYKVRCQSTEEFMSDINRIKYIKKLITRFVQTGNLEERLVLNHIVILNNVFGPEFLSRMIYLKMYSQMNYIKPFLVYLNIMQDKILNVNGKSHNTLNILMNQQIVDRLRDIDKQSRR